LSRQRHDVSCHLKTSVCSPGESIGKIKPLFPPAHPPAPSRTSPVSPLRALPSRPRTPVVGESSVDRQQAAGKASEAGSHMVSGCPKRRLRRSRHMATTLTRSGCRARHATAPAFSRSPCGVWSVWTRGATTHPNPSNGHARHVASVRSHRYAVYTLGGACARVPGASVDTAAGRSPGGPRPQGQHCRERECA